jgi:hypothetical protein
LALKVPVLWDFFSEKKFGTINANAIKKHEIIMKKILTSIVLFALIIINTNILAQTTHPVELGFNLGASWLQSDVKMKKLGGAGGFTFGQMYLQNDKSALDWGWRFRYLNATAYGQDSKKSGILNNNVLNGITDTTLNYNSNGGKVYQNYKTTMNELSLELVIGANRMRNKTKVYPYIFGGLGITKAVAKTDQLNSDGVRYNYLGVDSLGTASSSTVTTSLNSLYDGSYETAAEGSETARWKFMPSLGVGLGYQFSPGVSMGLEHKMTWALHDGLDGQQWANDNTLSTSKDKYHYTSVWLKFSFGRKARPVTTTLTNNNTVNPDTYTPATNKPTVAITNPAVSSYTSPSQSYTVRATIKNVSSKSDIGLVYNGVSNTNFTYDATTKQFAFPLMLLTGSNTFMITATNADGSTTDNATVIFEAPIVVTPPSPAPFVTITSPAVNPFSTYMNSITVLASVLNVASQSQIGVTVNGVATGSFVFNASSKVLNVTSNLNPGANTFVISASNASGSDSKSITVIYNVAAVTPPPVITVVNPAVNPFTSSVSVLPINAIVQHVTSVGQISVTNNGAPLPTSLLSFNASSGQLNFNSNLIAGANTITISATNVAGADSKSITVIYNQPVAVVPAPVVTITSPTVNPYATSSNVATVNAIVLNVTSPAQISVLVNGMATATFSYNLSTKQLTMTSNLIAGANIVTITASTASGSDSKSQTIIYSQPVATPAPVVTITTPNVNPYTTAVNTTLVNATIINVLTASQISVTLNGAATTAFYFNAVTKQLSLNASLIAGANIVTISATNASGSDSKSQTIIYSQPIASPAPIVTITSPAVNPYTSTANTTVVTATVINVLTASEISVSLNGVSTSSFSYNVVTKQLSYSASLIAGANMITISAANASGSDSKSQTIIYSQPVATPAPVVTITSPTANPYTSASNIASVTATVLNVSSSSQIAVSVNGSPTIAFTYNVATKALSMNVNLIAGANVVTITATNVSGSDSKSVTLIYSEPVATIPAPVVTIVLPNINPSNTAVNTAIVKATVLNVSSSSQITVTINGANIPFSYTAATMQLTLSASLVSGGNSVTISAVNTSGSDSKSTTIIYTAPVVLPAPVITFIKPTGLGGGSSTAVYNVEATVLNVLSSSNITVKVNGLNVTAFTYNATTKLVKFNANLTIGNNTVVISATNTSGSDSKSVVIKYRESITPLNPDTLNSPATKGTPNVHTPVLSSPQISGIGTIGIVGSLPTIVFGLSNPYAASTPVVAVTAVVKGITFQSDIEVKVNGVVIPFTYTIKTNTISFSANVNPGENTITVKATNSSGPKTENLTINR